MAWKAIDRIQPVVDPDAAPLLSDAVREKIRSFFGRYETKRAAVLPALQIAQNELGHVSLQAMVEIAELLELQPSEVYDTATFYTHFWTEPKGRKTIVCCRSTSCALLNGDAVLQAFKDALGIGEHQTTADGEYSLMTEECLAGCDHAPCVLINERLHHRVKPEDVPQLLADPDNDKLDVPRSTLFDPPPAGEKPATASEAGPDNSAGR
jgi:NADH:ubiquinone oxidoreductase subunit E